MTIRDVKILKENSDGSAVYSFDFSPDEIEAFTRMGIIAALQNVIDDAKQYDPEQITFDQWYYEDLDTESRHDMIIRDIASCVYNYNNVVDKSRIVRMLNMWLHSAFVAGRDSK